MRQCSVHRWEILLSVNQQTTNQLQVPTTCSEIQLRQTISDQFQSQQILECFHLVVRQTIITIIKLQLLVHREECLISTATRQAIHKRRQMSLAVEVQARTSQHRSHSSLQQEPSLRTQLQVSLDNRSHLQRHLLINLAVKRRQMLRSHSAVLQRHLKSPHNLQRSTSMDHSQLQLQAPSTSKAHNRH